MFDTHRDVLRFAGAVAWNRRKVWNSVMTLQDATDEAVDGVYQAIWKFDPQKGAALTTFAWRCASHQIGRAAKLLRFKCRDRRRHAKDVDVYSLEIPIRDTGMDRMESREEFDQVMALVRSKGRLGDIMIRRRLDEETLESIGRDYGVTRERIRQIEEKGSAYLSMLESKLEGGRPLVDRTRFSEDHPVMQKASRNQILASSRSSATRNGHGVRETTRFHPGLVDLVLTCGGQAGLDHDARDGG